MRRLSIISYFPQLGVALLGTAVATAYAPGLAMAAPSVQVGASATAKGGSAGVKAGGTSVNAGPDAAAKKAAREAYAAGEKAYTAGDYKTASVEFRKANEQSPTIHAQFWLAMAESHGENPGASYEALAAALASPEASKLGDDKLAAGNARLEELKKAPATVVLTSIPTGAEVAVDGAPQTGVTPLTVSLPPGPHKLTFKLAGYDNAESDVTLKPGQNIEQPSVELKKTPEPLPAPIPVAAPLPAPEPPPVPAKEPRSKLPAYITLGVGVAAAGVGTVFGIKALGSKSDFNDNPTNDNADKADRNALIADMAFGVALTLGITGIVLLTTDDSSDATASNGHGSRLQRAKLQVAPVITPTTTGAGARFVF